jgi:hypothetical protein
MTRPILTGCHKTVGATPAVAAGVSDHVWTLSELVGLLEEAEATPIRRGSYANVRGEISTWPTTV